MVVQNLLYSVTLFLLLSLQYVSARTLTPIRPSSKTSNEKRADPSALELQSSEIFLWGDFESESAVLANFTVYMPGDNENILSMEKFNGMLASINCSNGLTLAFNDYDTFSYAQKVWDWVNGADDHSFVMVAGVGDCGNNTHRLPFVVSSIQYDEELNTAHLAANVSDWKTIAHSFDMVVGRISGNDTGLYSRDITKSLSVDVSSHWPFSVKLSSGKLSAELACTNCSTTGEFDIEFRISQKWFIPTGASMRVSPKGVSAIAQVKFTGAGAITNSLTKTWDIVNIPIDGITIPGGILDLGPFLTVAVGVELSAVTISASIQGGGTATFSDSAVVQVDLLNPTNNKFSGWTPSIEALPIRVDEKISGGVSMFVQPSLELRAEALGQGFKFGLNLRVPNVNAKLEFIDSPQGACTTTPAGQQKHEFGVRISANIGAQLNLAASKIDGSDPLFKVQIATLDVPLAQECWDFGPIVGASTPSASGNATVPKLTARTLPTLLAANYRALRA
ncbi:hypothetical protein K432DRAFT_430220 [Lepidopterella palustris CBS 459.81]|uniref:Uncharacterized protein n=1 Tax=Lepidopterella palustris CBS 459.81 TaxID=1314670 RepID=A0A8E2DYY6_9PEZI|nr:hypothetical protein K432DRAFT_430220 [Lepidopterella palustris CBS 459.81]